MTDTSKQDQENPPWSYYFGKTFSSGIFAILWLLVALFIQDFFLDTGKVSKEIGMVFLIGAGIIAGYYAIKCALYGFVTIAWPLLVMLGVVGVAGAAVVQKLDEGGLKSVSDRIWYGKDGPPKG